MVKLFSKREELLPDLLQNPEVIKSYNTHDWNLFLRVAKKSSLLAHIGSVIQKHKLEHCLPEKIKDNIKSAQTIIDYRKRTALWELNRLWRALIELDHEIIVLKGGAYLLSHLPFSENRMFADIDILVNKDAIKTIEQTLLNHNWQSAKINEYDQNYYRKWMHEIPPLRHSSRAIEVDIHHTILPLTCRLHPNPEKLISAAVDSGYYRFKILSPCDMTLHSATHLFYDSDLSNKLKDLVDLDQLLTHFNGIDRKFFNNLIKRAHQLELQRPLFYALLYTHKLLGTSIPVEILRDNAGAPPYLIRGLMDWLVPIAILPEHPDYPKTKVAIARWLLYVRSHYLRMPLKLLIPHLLYKSKVRWQESKSTA